AADLAFLTLHADMKLAGYVRKLVGEIGDLQARWNDSEYALLNLRGPAKTTLANRIDQLESRHPFASLVRRPDFALQYDSFSVQLAPFPRNGVNRSGGSVEIEVAHRF